MSEHSQCAECHIFKNGSYENGLFHFHFEQYPEYKFRSWINKITAWVCALLVMLSIDIYGDKISQSILLISMIAMALSAILYLENFLHTLAYYLLTLPSGETYTEVYKLTPKTTSKIRYKKHLFWHGYLVTMPAFESLEKDGNGKRMYFPIKRHKISCVKNIDVLEEMIDGAIEVIVQKHQHDLQFAEC